MAYDPFGAGVTLPIERRGRDLNTARGAALVQTRVEMALGVRGPAGATRGEVRWDGSRGSRLFLLKNAPQTPLLYARAQRYVIEALNQVPQVQLVSVKIRRENTRDRTTYVDVAWRIHPEAIPALGASDDVLRTFLTTTRL